MLRTLRAVVVSTAALSGLAVPASTASPASAAPDYPAVGHVYSSSWTLGSPPTSPCKAYGQVSPKPQEAVVTENGPAATVATAARGSLTDTIDRAFVAAQGHSTAAVASSGGSLSGFTFASTMDASADYVAEPNGCAAETASVTAFNVGSPSGRPVSSTSTWSSPPRRSARCR